ncbi:hypothetical protein Dimus_000522 [Dionaea muscipula]
MAKRGRPRKRGGATRADVNPRVSIVGSAGAQNEKVLPDEEVHVFSDSRADVQSTLEGLGIVWADEEDEQIENVVAVDLVRGAPYRTAVQSSLEEKGANSDLESNPMAGNRDRFHNGRPMEKKLMSDEWIPARKPALVAGSACRPASSKMGEASGSRFCVLDGKDDDGACSQKMVSTPPMAHPLLPLHLTIIAILLLLLPSLSFAANYNVVSFGARPGGTADSSSAFLNAWNAACGSAVRSTIVVPAGKFLVGNPVVFSGQNCRSSGGAIDFRILGTLVAPADYQVLGNAGYWISFLDVSGVTISGGILDAQGAPLWACKNNGGYACPGGATTLTFTNSQNVVISGLTSLNSQLYHIVINNCHDVNIHGVRVVASGNSPNTDGIHVQMSTGVTISSTRIGTGDDCISMGPGTTNMWIQGVVCGPGHGISIGSLGKNLNEAGVQNVTVTTSTFSGTQNGVRIKTWGRPSNGFVRNVVFEHLTMANVKNPIIIDQNYCPSSHGCPGKASGIKISDVIYQDIHGTSATEVAVTFDCSSKYPCSQISMQDVQLTYNSQVPLASCVNAGVSSYGHVQPTSCL